MAIVARRPTIHSPGWNPTWPFTSPPAPKSAVVAEIYVQLNIALHGSFHCKSYLARELLLGCALVYNRLYS